MNAQELRIGNYIQNIEGDAYCINSIYSKEFYHGSYLNSGRHLRQGKIYMLPIPLTEDWLVKLGFEMSSTGFIEKGRLLYHKEYGWKILENWVMGWNGVAEIKYVHQLQNLYYALTGEELTLK